jgi:hypothetical protein
MQKKHWLLVTGSVLLIRALTMTAAAQEGVAIPAAHNTKTATAGFRGERGLNGFQSRLEKTLGLSSEQREAVQGLLAQQRTDMRALSEEREVKYTAIRKQTDAKIRALLNPDQQKKFDALLAKQQASAPRGRKPR